MSSGFHHIALSATSSSTSSQTFVVRYWPCNQFCYPRPLLLPSCKRTNYVTVAICLKLPHFHLHYPHLLLDLNLSPLLSNIHPTKGPSITRKDCVIIATISGVPPIVARDTSFSLSQTTTLPNLHQNLVFLLHLPQTLTPCPTTLHLPLT